jgi:NinB protein
MGNEGGIMAGQTIILVGDTQREYARRMIAAAPSGAVVNIREATRTTDQNAKMWAMISDVSRAMPQGRTHTTEVWKCLFMQACGHQSQFAIGLDGGPFPIGFSSSRLTKAQMSDLIETIYQYGAEHGVQWSESVRTEAEVRAMQDRDAAEYGG